MRIAWFARAYDWFVPWKDALFAQIRSSWVWRYGRMLKTRIKLRIHQAWVRMRPRVAQAWQRWTGRELHFGGPATPSRATHEEPVSFKPTESPTGKPEP